MHHYDMNLCYIDELLWHFNWTGDLDYARRMWPLLTLHLAWEKRNFDLITTAFTMPMPVSGQVTHCTITVELSHTVPPITIVAIGWLR